LLGKYDLKNYRFGPRASREGQFNMKVSIVSVVVFALFCGIRVECHGGSPETTPAPWKSHVVRQLNGKAGEIRVPAQLQIVTESQNRTVRMPYLVYMPEKKQLLMLTTTIVWPERPGTKAGPTFRAELMNSDDNGTTWTQPRYLHVDAKGNADVGICTGLTYLGNGKVMVTDERAKPQRGWRSEDYGVTWNPIPKPSLPNGQELYVWDPALVDRDPVTGKVTRVVETCYSQVISAAAPGIERLECQGRIRFSSDEGRTWTEAQVVPQWKGVNEVALLRARNGDLIGACRTDIPPRINKDTDLDYNCGLAVSVSQDNGRTWSKLQRLYEYGRHQPSMGLLPNGGVVMTYAARLGYTNTPDGFPQFGVEAIVSHDNGQSWDLDHRYLLHTWVGGNKGKNFFAGAPQSTSSLSLSDGEILTAFGAGYRIHLPGNPHDVGLIRWQVNDKGLNADQIITQAPFDSDLRNQFDPSPRK
jgi:hypothetical protein